jgi:hypothetical protein
MLKTKDLIADSAIDLHGKCKAQHVRPTPIFTPSE